MTAFRRILNVDRLGILDGPPFHPGRATVAVTLNDFAPLATITAGPVVLRKTKAPLTFNPPPPPDAPTVTLDRVASVSRNGKVTLHGTITCHHQVPPDADLADEWFIRVVVRQRTLPAYGGAVGLCRGGSVPWTATIRSDAGGRFHPGRIGVLVSAGATYASIGATSAFVEARVRLHPAR